MSNTLREEWLHGPDADPDPAVAETVALITEYQLGLLSDVERQSVQQRLATDQSFAAVAAPILFAERVLRCDAERQERAGGESARIAKIIALSDAERSAKRATQPLHPKRRSQLYARHPSWRLAASVMAAVSIGTVCTVSAYGAVLRARIPPVSVTFTNAPLAAVMAELRHHYHIEVEVCDAGYNQDRVTMTVADVPIDSVTNIIDQQTLRWAHWKVPYTGGPYTLLLQPQPDLERGWWYNLRLFARSFTYLGCRR